MNKLSLNPSVIARILGVVAALLILANIGGVFSSYVLGYNNLNGLIPLFNLDWEYNIPTYFSMLLLLFAAALLATITLLNRKQRVSHVSKWAILSLGFLYMAYDEAFQNHEKLIDPIRALFGDSNLGVFYFAWVIPGVVLVCVAALFFLKFLLYLPAITRLRFMIAAILYLGGAVGFELIGGCYSELYGEQNWIYSMITTVEESLEMAGLIAFIWALLQYLSKNFEEVILQFKV